MYRRSLDHRVDLRSEVTEVIIRLSSQGYNKSRRGGAKLSLSLSLSLSCQFCRPFLSRLHQSVDSIDTVWLRQSVESESPCFLRNTPDAEPGENSECSPNSDQSINQSIAVSSANAWSRGVRFGRETIEDPTGNCADPLLFMIGN